MRELVENSRVKTDNQQEQSDNQMMLMNTLTQIKIIGDKKMQLSQQMLDATERQSKKLKIAHQKYSKIIEFCCIFNYIFFSILVESINQQNSLSDNNSNDMDSENEYDSESSIFKSFENFEKLFFVFCLLCPHRSLSTKSSTTSLWKRKATNSTINLKRKCVMNSEQNEKFNNNERDRKKPIQNNNINNGKKLRLNNESSTTQSDETTYCLCSQVREKELFFLIIFFFV